MAVKNHKALPQVTATEPPFYSKWRLADSLSKKDESIPLHFSLSISLCDSVEAPAAVDGGPISMSQAMDEEFTQAVEDGLKLAKRVCYSKDRYAPPKPVDMDRLPATLQLTSPMMYAIIYDPAIVDNPDLPSYQPYVYGKMDPPALIPLHMKEIGLEVECYIDTAVVTMTGSWSLHCVMGSKSCDCRLVVPMGEQGSILGVEAEVSSRSYFTQVIQIEEDENTGKTPKVEIGGFLKPQVFSLTIPQVSGGSTVKLKVQWLQKLLYRDGEFSIGIPFTFPEFVNPFGKHAKRERIKLNVNSGNGMEVLCQATSHALRQIRRQSGNLLFSYEADVLTWSYVDFHFSYTVYSGDLFGGVLLQSPPKRDFDQREMLCLYIFPGNTKHKKVFRNEVVFIVDTSESMRGRTLENVANALSATISELSPGDSFNIICFNDKTCAFSPSLELATDEMIKSAIQWINKKFVAEGGTNIMQPLNEAMGMLSSKGDSIPHIFLVTDGSVEDERSICSAMREHITSRGPKAPRISTFGLGSYCNHYFLRMLATIGRGHYDAAFDAHSIDTRLQSLFKRALSPLLADITIDVFDHLGALEVYPFPIPDLSYGCPLIAFGRYQGTFPDSVKVKGLLADMTNCVIDLKVQKTKDIPVDKVFAKQQLDMLTAQAWLSDSKQLQEKVVKLSKQHNLASEYSRMVLDLKDKTNPSIEQEAKKIKLLKHTKSKSSKLLLVGDVTIGFGNVAATTQNLPTGFADVKLPEPSIVFQKAAGCCNAFMDCCCCACCIRMCSRLNDQCAIALTQLCTALSCLACMECCSVCCDNSD